MSLKLKVALSRVRSIIVIKDIYMKSRWSNNTKFEYIYVYYKMLLVYEIFTIFQYSVIYPFQNLATVASGSTISDKDIYMKNSNYNSELIICMSSLGIMNRLRVKCIKMI